MADKTIILSKDPSQLSQEIPLIEGDNNTYVIRFVAPRYSGGVDLANLTWGVNIKNATLEQGFVNLSSATSDDSAVYIDWNVGSFATVLHGSSFCTIEGRNNSSSAHPVWKSSIVTLRVGRSVSADDIIDGSNVDSITEIAENVAESIVANSVRYDTSQSLNSTQKTTARTNIGATSQAEVQQAVATETSAREAAVSAEAAAREAAYNAVSSALLLSIQSNNVTTIPDNTNYNGITDVGNYVVKTASSAATMVNCPTTSGHRLFVLATVETSRILQIIITNDVQPKIYKRYYRGSWSNWTYIADDVDLGNINDLLSTKLELAFTHRIEIPANSDLNNYTTPGNYHITTYAIATTISNKPVNTSGCLFVGNISTSSRVVQIYWSINTNSIPYVRMYDNSGWGEWKQLATINDATNIATTAVAAEASAREAADANLSNAITTEVAAREAVGNKVDELSSALLLSIASLNKVTRIPNNTDYDNLLTAGNYVVKSAASAATMVHCPTTSGHRLFVIEVVETTRILQVIITNDVQPKIYKRYYLGSWGDWTYIADNVDLNNIKNDILTNIIDPDKYTGTDNQKLASAITAAGYDKNSVIIIRRMYTLTDNVLLNHNHECTGKMIFLGIGDGCGFNMAQYGFRSPDTSTRGMISFVNLQFNATNIYFDCDYLIRLYFENCSFNGGNRVLYATRYIQSVYFHNCVIRECAKSVIASRNDGTEGSTGAIYDLHFVECTIEKCNGFIELYRGIGCSVSDCCIEALSNYVLKVSHSVNGVVFDSNYFEQNNTGYYAPENWDVGAGDGTMFDLRTTAEYDTKPNHLVITNNMIYQPSGTGVIKLRAEPYEKGHVIVKDNVCSGASNIILIATASGTTKIHNDVIIEGNTNATYIDGNYIVSKFDYYGLQMRGKISDLGYTSISQCVLPGAYTFSSNDVNNISDLPSGWSSGGLVVTYKNDSVVWQEIKTTTCSCIRYGLSGTWINLLDTVLGMRASMSDLGYTSFGQCLTPGVYTFSTSDLNNITDKPDGLVSGGLLIVYAVGTTMWQEIKNNPCHFMRYGTTGGWYDHKEFIFVSYNSGTGDDDSVAQINIDLKKDRQGYFIRYQMGHCVSESVNADVWRLMYLYKVYSAKTSASVMTRKGEFECALHLDGRDDFSGGVVHGDELDQNVTFICDGVITSESNVGGLWKNFTVVRNSVLYDPEDSTTPIAEHGVEYIYTPNGLTIKQSVKWLVAESLTNCYLAMLPILKTYSGVRYDDTSFSVTQNPASGLNVIIPNATSVTEIGNDVSSSVSIPVYPSGLTGGDCALLIDNGGLPYNKVYFVVCSSGTTQIGELWKSTTNYDIH